MTFLKPFAQQGKVVSEADVRGFFASLVDDTKKTWKVYDIINDDDWLD